MVKNPVYSGVMTASNSNNPEYAVDESLMAPQPTTQDQPKAQSSSQQSKSSSGLGAFFAKFKPNSSSHKPKETNTSSKTKKVLIGVGISLAILLGVVAALGGYTYLVLQNIMAQADQLQTTGQSAYQAYKAQDLPTASSNITLAREQLETLGGEYQKLRFYSFMPVARNYYLDGQAGIEAGKAGLDAAIKAVEAVEPYADVLGFTGESSFEGGTAENRVKLILETLDVVVPQLDAIGADLEKANQSLAQIDPNDYPETFRGRAIRSNILEGKQILDDASTALTNYRPIIEFLPEIAGAGEDGRKKYLILFQNDNELRPTGGFLTAYASIFIENGVVTPEKSDDIYELDQKFRQRIPIPDQLGRYLTTERFWNLRDMNIDPDFKKSMDTFYEYYQQVPGEPDNIDGIVAVDTHVLTQLLEVVGPVEVPGYGTFSAEIDPACDCPQIILALSEIITRPTPYIREDRKGVLAPLMKAILTKIYASPRAFMADLFTVGFESLEGRHLQAYMFDPAQQEALEKIDAAGRLDTPIPGEDFLAIVDANLGGAKSNLFINNEVEQVVTGPENGKITKEVSVTYINSRRADNCNLEAGLLCLNSTLRDWHRLFLPPGAELLEAVGFVEQPQVYEQDGYTVIDGFFILEPNSQARVKLTYTVPYTAQEYRLQMWKQGGINPVPVTIDVNGLQDEFVMDKDTIFTSPF